MRRNEPVERLRVDDVHARLGELRPHEQGDEAGDQVEAERRDEVLDADHLVVGVDAEVVAPGVGAVSGVILGTGGPTGDPVEPVVERSHPEQEAERRDDRPGGQQNREIPDRVPVSSVPDAADERCGEPERQRRRPEGPEPAALREPPDASRTRGRRRGVVLDLTVIEDVDGHYEPCPAEDVR